MSQKFCAHPPPQHQPATPMLQPKASTPDPPMTASVVAEIGTKARPANGADTKAIPHADARPMPNSWQCAARTWFWLALLKRIANKCGAVIQKRQNVASANTINSAAKTPNTTGRTWSCGLRLKPGPSKPVSTPACGVGQRHRPNT